MQTDLHRVLKAGI